MSNEINIVTSDDIEAIWEIVCENGWKNYSIDDLKYILAVSPKSNFKLVIDGKIAGAIFGVLDNNCFCISFFCVSKNERKFKNSHRLGKTILEYSKMNAGYIMTYANKKMIDVYKRYGFIAEKYIGKYIIHSCTEVKEKNRFIERVELNDLSHEKLIPEELQKNIKVYLDKYCNSGCKIYRKDNNIGCILYRQDNDIKIVGPLIADDESIARELLTDILSEESKILVYGEKNSIIRFFDKIGNIEDTNVEVLKMTMGNKMIRDKKINLIGGHHFIS